MSRYTQRDEYGNADIIGVDSADLQLNLEFKEFNRVTDALNRLAAYEDAEEQGLLVVLPCKVGDTVYAYDDVFNQIAPFQVDMVQLYGHGSMSLCANWRKGGELMADLDFDKDDIGKTVFLTCAEAEAALQEGAEHD